MELSSTPSSSASTSSTYSKMGRPSEILGLQKPPALIGSFRGVAFILPRKMLKWWCSYAAWALYATSALTGGVSSP
ncbi:hypothetical protein TMatcc_010608 [Talaromyces marneffei ATCC 18224]|uniref:uncharacterized protein n=1 Tax=Talaromyces marneffei TaxID=37727 RepID=UPI0012A90685|nr:uncharacterized protein EYB26_009619 [Talaromyces marneffei]KAE8548563.1 hypothetical protein EYB25_008944 [Talaromyces marneffei]QGA21905.1 hypothetical protein EYB26_009619 [Talaromyces marneffei]